MTFDELAALVRVYLAADVERRSSPCTHRYRGAIRQREIARRARVWREALTALERAVKPSS